MSTGAVWTNKLAFRFCGRRETGKAVRGKKPQGEMRAPSNACFERPMEADRI